MSPEYRADIDGLRAVAVSLVVFYHAFPVRVPAGFVGVDVFFVISGFLISRLIIDQLARGTFSFVDFYGRRVKRIFPALLLVLAVTYGFGWWVLLADEFAQLGGHIAGGAGFVANLVLWHEAGYFDNASDTKPLLHLWSLGIEEQFYLVWPCMLWYSVRRRWPLPTVLGAIAVLSFAANLIAVDYDAVSAFYAPYARFWELCVGALLTCIVREFRSSVTLHGTGLLGGALLIASLYAIDDKMPFPGGWALLPVLGTALLIAAGPLSWPNRVLLSARPLVWLGLISYPLYLWHWPLLSYARIIGNQAPSPAVSAVAVLLALLLAWLSFAFVERPLRRAQRGSKVIPALVASMVAIGALGYGSVAAGGWPSRSIMLSNASNASNAEQLEWDLFHSPACDHVWGANMDFCLNFGSAQAPRVVVLGDSTANAMAPGLGAWVGGKGDGLVNVGSNACPPVRGLVQSPAWKMLGRDCLAGVPRTYERLAATPSIEWVVLVLFAPDLKAWGIPGVAHDAPPAQRFAALKPLLEADLEYLRAAGKKVIVSYDAPLAWAAARDCIVRPLNAWLVQDTSPCYTPEARLRDRQPALKLFDDFMADHHDICVFRQSELLIRDGRMRFVDEEGRLLLRDKHHLSKHGSARMAELFARRCGASIYPP